MTMSKTTNDRLFAETDHHLPGRKGPPNLMNDLSYRDWMKFQKSFFRFTSTQKLIEDCIFFFTKSIRENGSPSMSLVVGSDRLSMAGIPAPRIVHAYCALDAIDELVCAVRQMAAKGNRYDFVSVDLRHCIRDQLALSVFLDKHSANLFDALRQVLLPRRYCVLLVATESNSGAGFPLPWAVADSSRSYLKLRDEKIGLLEGEGGVFYCLFMQNEEDERSPSLIRPGTFSAVKTSKRIPAWIIPKPPRRNPHEMLHPAKFPEALIEVFIELLTNPGDSVFDPMVGTGSTVVAAIRANRHGYGLDLVPEFVKIASSRALAESTPELFPRFRTPVAFQILEGDATQLDEIRALSGLRFNYVVTSPPYWSVLTNKGSEGQRARRTRSLPLKYSDDSRDLGNVEGYDDFLDAIGHIYALVSHKLESRGYLTVIVKNVKRHHTVYPLAWDIAARLCGSEGNYDYLGTTLWCQDDISIKPFAVGIHWVSNVLHQYCMHFSIRRESRSHRRQFNCHSTSGPDGSGRQEV